MASQGSVGQKVPDEQTGLSQEKLIEKYKSALNIAQKAKNARDEAMKNCKLLQNENEQLKEKVSTVEKQYKTAEEMLAALTDQKLKLAMEIDDLKKEKRIYFEELKSKNNLEGEVENYKSEFKKLLKENEDIISTSEETITKMRKEHEELKKRNETLKQVCNNIQIEKSELEKNLNASNKKLSQFEDNQNLLNSILAKKYNTVVDEFKNWAAVIDSKEDSFAKLQLLEMENETLKSEKDKLNTSNQSLTKDKESMELEMVELNDRIKKICLELDAANADRDKMLNNLEKVSLETKRLIENSEVLTQELGLLKEERASMEHLINVLNNEKQSLLQIVAEKEADLTQLASELERLAEEKAISLVNSAQEANLRNLEDSNSENNTTQTSESTSEDSSEKERSVNIELLSLQNDLKAFSAEIESYKIIVKESEAKLQEALESISEKEQLLKSQQQIIIELRSKVDQMEGLQAAIANSLSGTKEQLVTALEELEDIDRLKDDLQQECLLKDEEFLVACHKLEIKEHFIKEIIDGMEGLRLELNNIHKIDSLEEEFDTENSQPEDYIKGLKKCMDAIICKMFHNYKNEIECLREIINEYQENNEALAIDNNKLSKQAKDLLNEQANFDSGLVVKLKTFKENLLHQVKEKQSVVASLEKEVSTLKDQLAEKDNIKEKVEADKNDLKSIHDKMVSETSLEIKTLSEKLRDTEMRYQQSISSFDANSELISNLKDEIKDLKDFIVSLENRVEDGNGRNSHLTHVIISLSSQFEKENKELKNLISVMNSTLLENINEVTTNVPTDQDDIKKGFSEIELHRSLMACLSNELDRLKECENLAKEEINSKLSVLNEENQQLSDKVKVMTEKTEELRSSISNIGKAFKVLIEFCSKNKVPFTSKELEQITELLPSDMKEISDNLKILDKIQSDLESNANKIIDLESLLKEKEDYIKSELGKKDSVIDNLKQEIDVLKDKVDNVSSLNDSLNSDLSNFKENLERLRSEYNREKDVLLDKNNKIQNELKDCKELLDFKSLELRENNRIWAGRFSSLKVALIGLNKTRKEIRNQFQSIESSFNSFLNGIKEPLQEKIELVVQNAVAASKAELIREMHQMNQALKERGEMISKLEFTITDCHTKMKQLTSVSEKLQSELVQVKTELRREEDAVKEKDQLIKQLEVEIEQLKENHESTAPDNDVLSTSTISKTEEHSRLKDVEDSFEDRYMKLKLIAVKLKKRAADLSLTLESERAKFGVEKADFQEKISSMSMAVKNAQKIQELFDESLDERDKLKKDNEQLKNTVEELKKNELGLNNKISTLESSNQSIPVMKKHIDSLNTNIKESKSEIQRLQMEIKAEVIKYEEMKKSANKFEATVQELTSQLEQAKQQGKNNTVLELEMKNYEKIIADLSSQLNIERSTIKSLKSENEALSNVKIGLHEQISILEKQIAVEQQRIQDAQDQLAIFQSRLEEKNTQIETLNSSIGELKKQLTEEKNKNEALTMEMSAVTSEYSKKEMAMLSKISSSQDEIRSLETSLQSTKQELATAKREIDHLNEEYESYKLRAQTILAKKKGDLVTHAEKEAKEECDRLKRECASLEERLDSAMSEIDTLNTRISSLNLEKARSEKKYDEIRTALQQKLVEHDVLSTEMYNLKMANEVAVEQLKAELTKKKNEYQAELSHHKKIIDDLMLEFKQKEEENVIKDKVDNSGYSLSNFPESILPSSEREDGEGSESVPSPKTRRHSGVVPLDVLLNSPDESKVIVLQEQVEKLQKDLGRSEVRARHLSSLLSEAEKDSARNLHQNKVLKEELRRLERALERQPHVANTEYLKNVIFKFVTLPNGDERSRLVPVLDTLLKFSPEETHKLCSVAKGEAQAGWGSYLQSWTGL
ncbi:unnamed protein product [Nezara viridula]|uniref:GRIP domain-containing protein n=1 Tax=Nezara viridula TaxID=85310 RepID=A0A9P0HSB2_NEZVI|nr:unnamed protein product [Nezara viridula]